MLKTKLAKRLAKTWYTAAMHRILAQDLERQEMRDFYLQTKVDFIVFDRDGVESWADVQDWAEAGEAWAVEAMAEFDKSFV